MKIIYVTASLPYGTDEAFIVPEVRELTRAGHEVLVVPRSPRGAVLHGRELLKQARPEPLYSANVWKSAAAKFVTAPVRTAAAARLPFASRSAAVTLKNLAVVPKALWLAELAGRWGADHIHCHWAGTTATMTMVASMVSDVPWSLTLHRWDIVENNLLAAKVDSASFVRFISQDGLRMAREIGIRPAEHVRVLGMGVAIPDRARHVARPKPVVLCPARLVQVKGHRFLLEAWRLLRSRGLDAELWLAGDGELRPRLEALSGALGIGASVKFLGAVPHDRLVRIYEEGAVSAVALASIDMGSGNHEGIPVALIEAMSFGIPIVATATGGTAELVQPGCGLLTPPENPVALADSLDSLLRNETFAEQIAETGRRRAVACHDIVRVASELAAAFASVRSRTPAMSPQFA